MKNKNLILLLLIFAASNMFAAAQRRTVQTNKQTAATRTLTVVTGPRAAIWLDDLRRGTTDEKGFLTIERVAATTHKLRVRAVGFAEKTQTFAASNMKEIKVALIKTEDAAIVAFQQAEFLRESGDKQKAQESYRQALKLRAVFPEANVGLARLLETTDFDEALRQIAAARRSRPAFAEASTVEGRIYRENSDADSAIKSFRRAVRESSGVNPEAHTGLALALEDKDDYAAAVTEFRQALTQLRDTDPTIYRLLGDALARLQRNQEAVQIYEKFLSLAPADVHVSAVRSIVEQLKNQSKTGAIELLPQ